MCQGRQISARADASLLRNDRVNPVIEHGHEALGQQRPHSAGGHHQAIGPQKHQGSNHVLGKRIAHARRMTQDQIALEDTEPVGIDFHRGELAESGIDSVDSIIGSRRRFHHFARLRHPAQCLPRDGDRRELPRDSDDVLYGEGVSVEDDFGWHGRGI